MKYSHLLTVCILLGLAATSHSADRKWTNSSFGNFSDASNWTSSTVPGGSDKAIFDSGLLSGHTVNFTSNATSNKILIDNDNIIFNLGGNTYNLTGDSIIGRDGTGILNIEGGGVVTDVDGYLGYFPDSPGEVNVTGANSRWENTGGLQVGRGGAGVLNIAAGGVVTANGTIIGRNGSSTGLVEITGSNSQLINNSLLYVGYGSDGMLNIADGGGVSTGGNGYLGYLANSAGTITVGGDDSKWEISQSLYLGGDLTSGGTGILNINPGGTVEVGGTTTIHSTTDTVINLAGGTLITDSIDFGGVDPFPNFNWTGGTLHITGAPGASTLEFSQGSNVLLMQDIIDGGDYVDLKSTHEGGFFTSVEFLAGTNNSGAMETLNLSWEDGEFGSFGDVFHLTGIATGVDQFALQMTYDETFLTNELELALDGMLYLGWDDDGVWVNAVEGNFTNTASGDQLGYAGSFDFFQLDNGLVLGDYMGAWGYDTDNDQVWAVLDHNSSFSPTIEAVAVAEPSPYAMLALAGLAGLYYYRRKRHKRGAKVRY